MAEVLLVALGALFGWFLAQIQVVWSEDAHQIDEHIGDVQKLSDALQEYWLTTPEDHNKELRLAARVKAYHAATTEFYGEARRRLSLKRLRAYQMLSLSLYNTGLGGNFETKGRKCDGLRAIDSYREASKLIHLLRAARKDQILFRAMFHGYKV